jgi:hypothetical protein
MEDRMTETETKTEFRPVSAATQEIYKIYTEVSRLYIARKASPQEYRQAYALYMKALAIEMGENHE